MLNSSAVATSFSSSVARFFAPFAPTKGPAQQRKAMSAAFKQFAAENPQAVDSLFDRHFLMQHGEPIVADYLDGQLTRHQAAVDLAEAWEAHIMPPYGKMSKQHRADAVMAADRYLTCLPV